MSDPTADNGNQDHFETSKAHARAAAEEMRDAAAEAAREFRECAGSVAGEWKDKAHGVQREIEDYVRQNPTKSILAAVGIGFVLGLICRR
jgi:ElaB/YqjD/DUF883 family membrane-anchored ribosome-binding protein